MKSAEGCISFSQPISIAPTISTPRCAMARQIKPIFAVHARRAKNCRQNKSGGGRQRRVLVYHVLSQYYHSGAHQQCKSSICMLIVDRVGYPVTQRSAVIALAWRISPSIQRQLYGVRATHSSTRVYEEMYVPCEGPRQLTVSYDGTWKKLSFQQGWSLTRVKLVLPSPAG